MACCSWGVITSCWSWRNSNVGESTMAPMVARTHHGVKIVRRRISTERLAQVDLPDHLVAYDFLRLSMDQHLTIVNDIGPVDHIEGLADVVIGDHHANAALGEMAHGILDFLDRPGVDACERLVQQHERRARR